ncbi:MAG: phage tail sheath family protein, partial [Saprospiraceae bacterium]|nr:phage tail sheath family protein [Saprospiraceae bacterium]
PGPGKERTTKEIIKKFRDDVGTNHLQWAAAYYPWLEMTAVSSNDLNFKNFSNIGAVDGIVDFEDNPNAGQSNQPAKILAADKVTAQKAAFEAPDGGTLIRLLDLNLNLEFQDGLVSLARAEEIKAELKKVPTVAEDDVNTLHQTLLAISPAYKAALNDLKKAINVLPPSAIMAGIYSMVDNSVGVFQSPANVSVGSVVEPVVSLTNEEQEDLNMPLTGKAVNAIRTFPGKGVLVWGARTLDGNSQDWRYISVRRTVIFIEQSIKYAAEAYVFQPNVSATWTNLRALITNFLTNVWQQGALAGATPEDAFSVDVGLGTTMTAVDILDGIMRITVKIAVTRPAEFIVITFQQQMQKS